MIPNYQYGSFWKYRYRYNWTPDIGISINQSVSIWIFIRIFVFVSVSWYRWKNENNYDQLSLGHIIKACLPLWSHLSLSSCFRFRGLSIFWVTSEDVLVFGVVFIFEVIFIFWCIYIFVQSSAQVFAQSEHYILGGIHPPTTNANFLKDSRHTGRLRFLK